MSVCNALVWSNLSDAQIFEVFEQYPIGEKWRDDKRSNASWLQKHIDKARAYVTDRAEAPKAQSDKSGSHCGNESPAAKRYRRTDIGNAERLVDRHGRDLRFCHPFAKWYIWSGICWADDDTGEIKRRCKDTIRSMYAEASAIQDDADRKDFIKFVSRCESDQKIKAMISLAQSEPSIPVLPDSLDTHPWLVVVKNGTVDLRTGELLPHRRGDLITKVAPWRYDPDADCPMWMAHLRRVMDGDDELIDFLQRAYGYSLAGDTSERVIFIEYGSGANGKSITNDAVATAIGDYAMRTPTETLLVKRNEGIPNDVARLMGARFVYASEAEQGKRLAESLIKDMSGGEKIAARFMRAEWFEFMPEFKIWLGTNHKPVIRGTDNAIWDRIRLIPFTVRIPEDERKPKSVIMAEFESEMPGILAWLVKGCLKWRSEGLKTPLKVREATASYRDEMDLIGDFIGDCCVLGETQSTRKKHLYEAYESWSQANGEKPISKKLLGMKLAERGFDDYRCGSARHWIGIGLRYDA
jgi:putative DNA primase/helicase